MAIYDLGTASLSANGEVTGVGTTWKAPLTLIRVGATIVFKTEPVKIYTISEIISDTQINVYNPNYETVPAGTGYSILAHDGITVQGLAQDVAETLRYYQSRETEIADAVDAFNNFDSVDFESKVTQVNTQHGEVVTIGAQVANDSAQVSADKNAAAASAASAAYDKDAAAASAQEAADYAASLDTQNILRKDLALSDLTDKPLARSNLDVYSRGEVDAKIKESILYPESFGAIGDGVADDTAAVNSALQSGKSVIWNESKVYKVTGRIQANKDVYDLHFGVMNLDVENYGLGLVKIEFANKVQESDPIRGMYVESAYNFSELAFIKSLGINTIIHYGNFDIPVDSDGSLTMVADNVRALGMRMIVNTEIRDVKDPLLTLGQFIQKFDNHPAVFAWSTFDEAMSRGISYSSQREQYNTIRNYSNKPISLVDAWYNADVISNLILEDYDIVFADPYPKVHAGVSEGVAVEMDLKYMRRCYAGMQAHSRQKNVIPVLGLFTSNGSPGATSQTQIASAAEQFRKAGNGQFACFVWDGLGDTAAITGGIRGNALFTSIVRSSSERKYPVPYTSESILVGGNSAIGHQSLKGVLDLLPVMDSGTTDAFIGGGAYPIHIFSGASNTDRTITDSGWNVSGIGFKSTAATLVTSFPLRSNLLVYGNYSTIGDGSLNGVFQVLGTFDGGYTSNPRATQDVSGVYELIDLHATTPDKRETLCLRTTSTTDSGLYRRLFSGLIASFDW